VVLLSLLSTFQPEIVILHRTSKVKSSRCNLHGGKGFLLYTFMVSSVRPRLSFLFGVRYLRPWVLFPDLTI
jgi:hypothetical protein